MQYIFTDGSCINNGYPNASAGWAFIVFNESEQKVGSYTGKIRKGAQNSSRAELEAFCQAVKYLSEQDSSEPCTIYIDSERTIDFLNGKSTRNANKDIWKDIEKYTKEIVNRDIIGPDSVIKCDAHDDNDKNFIAIGNNATDKLANISANSLLLKNY